MAALQPVQLYVSDYANSNPGQNTVLCNDAVASVDLYHVTSYYIHTSLQHIFLLFVDANVCSII